MIEIFDTHAHLNDRSFSGHEDEAIARAADADVTRIMCVGYNMQTSRKAVEVAASRNNVWATVGVHPHDAKTLDDSAYEEIKELARNPKVVAIGEIGLDFFRDLSPRDVQESAFRKQLNLAKAMNLPVIIHNRDAGADILRVLIDEGPFAASGVMHCFSEDVDYALKIVEMGFYIGIAGPVTFKKNEGLRDVVRNVPIDRILVETDCPYLTPEPFRGRERNEPAFVRYVAERIAAIKDMSLEEVANQTTSNALTLFSKMSGGCK